MKEARFLSFLRMRPVLNGLMLLVYYLIVTLPHEWVGLVTVSWFGHLDRDTYNLYVSSAAVFSCILILFMLIPRLKRHPLRSRIIAIAVLNLLLSIAVVKVLFVIKIEVVHFFQYAGFALLCFPLVNNFFRTLVWTTLAGAVDEAYQYFYLAPDRTLYYDFNDVIANLTGGVFGILILLILGVEQRRDQLVFYRSPLIFVLLFIFLLVTIMFAVGILGVYPESGADFLLVRERAPGFWSVVHPNVTYHVVRPIEGVIIIIVLLLLYRQIFGSIYKSRVTLNDF